MKHVIVFETWNDNNIDDTLFVSGRAKYHPRVSNKKITYKSGHTLPYYTAEILQHGQAFMCNIFKHKLDGEVIRIKHKEKKNLKSAHNYVREYLNDRVENKFSERKEDLEEQDKEETKNIAAQEEPTIEEETQDAIDNMVAPHEPSSEPLEPPTPMPVPEEPRNKTIIRSFV